MFSSLLSRIAYSLLGIYFSAPLLAWDGASLLTSLKFKQISTLNGLPTDEVQKVYQDKDGLIWFATRYGLCQFDGYEVKLYKSNLYTPGLITSNNVYCLADDGEHNLWIGTQEGVNVLNKKTGKIRSYLSPAIPCNSVSCILVTRDYTVWLGTDAGLCQYNPQNDTFVIYDERITGGLLSRTPIKALYEDRDGDIWIGTWQKGLYRYNTKTKKIYSYPKFNSRNSAHVIFEDSHRTIWVGAWDEGLYKLNDPKNLQTVTFTNYFRRAGNEQSLSDNIVYDIIEDPNSQTLWVGTRSGLSIMKQSDPGSFINYKPRGTFFHIPYDELNSIIRDSYGNIWIASIGGGVLMTDTRRPMFDLHVIDLSDEQIATTAIRSLFVDSMDNLWIGVGSYGLACKMKGSGKVLMHSRIPEFSHIPFIPTVYSMIQRKNGEVWFGTYNGGVYVYQRGKKVVNLLSKNCDFLVNDCISALYEDSKKNCWVGTRGGMAVKLENGKSSRIEKMVFKDGKTLDSYYVKDIVEDRDHSVWVATADHGIIHISGDIRQVESLKFTNYSLSNRSMTTNAILCLHLDKKGRLWAGTEGGGLYLYNRNKALFEAKNREYNIPGDMIGSIEEDNIGNLWLGTNVGLARLNTQARGNNEAVRMYTSADGLQDNFFISGSSCNYHEKLYFGGYKGYNCFIPKNMEDGQEEVPFIITDIKFFNKSFDVLPPNIKNKISIDMPAYTQKIEIPYQYNNFSFEFAALTYTRPQLNQYAYRMIGFDREWQYTKADRRFAYYNNLKSGTYKFQLKATNEHGIWSGYIREIVVIILPPFWATWWAYLIYTVLFMIVSFYVYKAIKNRILLANELKVREIEQAKSEELNHAKLQFFTNITHELLTPLTIISATVEELKREIPGQRSLYSVMNNNINRLIRLLQQILEFRKAESGNLKLRVSQGDIVAFVKNQIESFLPLIKQRKIEISLDCASESMIGYFDVDKLDKILYNLLSNAAKYNKAGGSIKISLLYDKDKSFIWLSVKDNGEGISPEKLKDLFKRFYEGDYRKFNTIGTGIGLSLTKDLVELHKGTITVDSKLGVGTEFTIKLPIDSSYYDQSQIDNKEGFPIKPPEEDNNLSDEMVDVKTKTEKYYSILVVEDNKELLELMEKLLKRDYNVFCAENGESALKLLENEDIDLIVSDVMMPGMSGTDLCKYLKGRFEMSHIPIILLTAKNLEQDRVEAYEAGADAFISKPFNLAVLYARIRNLLKYKERVANEFKNQLVFEVKDLDYTSVDEEFMQRAIDCVNRHLDDCNFGQIEFVEEMQTSKSTLYKKLKSLTGLNTSAFIRNIRLKAACHIMQEKASSIRVSELAYAVGFNDPKYFSTCYKKEFGMLPSEYMERFIYPDRTISTDPK